MNELIGQLASKAGTDDVVAEKTIGIMQGLSPQRGPVRQSSEAAIAAASAGGGLGKLMGNGMMAIGTLLTAPGLGMGEIRSIARELVGLPQDKIGANQMGEIIAGTPGVSQFA